MIIRERFLSLGKKARGVVNAETMPQKFSKKPERIIIHWIGPYPGQAVATPWHWWENGNDGTGVRASAHYILKDGDVLQAVPLDEVAWHSGDMRNWDSIGIEVIPMDAEGAFSRASIDTLRLLVRHIRKETGLPLPLERHFDGAQRKPCPLYYTDSSPIAGGQYRWEELKKYLDGED